jgi:transposase-like protein
MGRNIKYSKELKLEIVKRFSNGEAAKTLADIYEVTGRNGYIRIYEWRNQYEAMGERAFDNKPRNKRYSKELKLAAIQEYLNGEGSLETISNKYRISSTSILYKWLKKYNSRIEIKDYDPKPEVYMAKSRKTTVKERIEIVNYCLSNGKNYKAAAIQYGVNYAQVFSWTKKYIEYSEEGLNDKRGRKKPESELNEVEKLKLENKKLLARNKYLEMESEVLKKLEELESEMVREKYNKRNTKR